MRGVVIPVVVLCVFASAIRAERPPEKREKADAVVVGEVVKISTKESKFGNDGVNTHYTAEVKVMAVEKAKGVTAGDTLKVRWSHVTKSPSKLLPGAYGHEYKIKKGDEAKFWLMGSAKKGFEIIYNEDGVEKVKR